ncbi:SRPBCC family protein [Rheinheimera salexigens]|uniref:Polyketide cyclase n=1 Tax=Rheinheimera salexigens TaxID=1628148 RepID=A0A1E7Q386_9GAMM|nr:SRPBCC family protein [Rheinheimera salexigens]OEY68570.1 polyketide cyclase [Rheinheimera salexigens]
MIKKILITLLVLLAIPLITALFVKNQYVVTTQVIIKQPVPVVFDYIRFLANQDNFSVWANIDPEMSKSYRGIDGTVGFVAAWHSEHPDVGTGEQEIIAIVEEQRIDYELRFLEPFTATAPAQMLTKAIGPDETEVTWIFEGSMPYPMNLMLLFVDMEAMIGEDLQQGLDNLKLILETPPVQKVMLTQVALSH